MDVQQFPGKVQPRLLFGLHRAHVHLPQGDAPGGSLGAGPVGTGRHWQPPFLDPRRSPTQVAILQSGKRSVPHKTQGFGPLLPHPQVDKAREYLPCLQTGPLPPQAAEIGKKFLITKVLCQVQHHFPRPLQPRGQVQNTDAGNAALAKDHFAAFTGRLPAPHPQSGPSLAAHALQRGCELFRAGKRGKGGAQQGKAVAQFLGQPVPASLAAVLRAGLSPARQQAFFRPQPPALRHLQQKAPLAGGDIHHRGTGGKGDAPLPASAPQRLQHCRCLGIAGIHPALPVRAGQQAQVRKGPHDPLGRVLRQQFPRQRRVPVVMGRADVEVCQVAPAIAGGQQLFPGLGVPLQQGHRPFGQVLCRLAGRHQPRRPGPYDGQPTAPHVRLPGPAGHRTGRT